MLGRARHDDELRRVYREHLDAVFGFFAYSVGREAAEDLASITFERVVKHWRKYDAGLASERTWILTIAKNTLIDHYRRQSHRQTTSIDEFPLIAERLAQDEHPLASRLAAEGFAGWLGELSDRDRLVLALRYAADLSGAEIAASTGLTEANVHQVLSRALRKLRAQAPQINDRTGDDA